MSIRLFTLVSLSGTVNSTRTGSLSITVEIISFIAGTTKLSTTLNGTPLFAINKETLYEAINPLTFWQVFSAKTFKFDALFNLGKTQSVCLLYEDEAWLGGFSTLTASLPHLRKFSCTIYTLEAEYWMGVAQNQT